VSVDLHKLIDIISWFSAWHIGWLSGQLVSSASHITIFTTEFSAGFRASIIDYAKRIEELFSKMEGVRAIVLPPNREPLDDYFDNIWEPVHSLTAAVTSLSSEPSNPEKFKPYLEAEEARLDSHLKSVDYTIDGTDTLTLITGVGRIEKVSILQRTQRYFRLTVFRPSFRYCTCC
jgi:hypothetical protein